MSDYDAIARARQEAGEGRTRADVTNLPPGYIEGFEASLDVNYHVTLTAGSTSVEGRQVTVNESHDIVDGDFVGTRLGQFFYYIYITSLGEFKVDRVGPEYSDQYIYYAHPIFNWRALGKLWVDSDNDIKYVTNSITGSGAFVTIAPKDADNPIDADYQCDGTNDYVFIEMALAFISGAYSGGEVRLLRGEFLPTTGVASALIDESNVALTGEVGTIVSLSLRVDSSADNVLLANFQSNDSTQIYGIRLQTCSNVTIRNVKFTSTTMTTGALLYSTADTFDKILVEGCDFTSSDRVAAIVLWGGKATITSCRFYDESFVGVRFYGDDCVVSNCIFDTLTQGVSILGGDRNVIISSQFTSCTTGISMDDYSSAGGDDNLASNNALYDCTTGIDIKAGADDNRLVANAFTGCATDVSDAGANTTILTTGGGNVGIGTSGPSTNLDVYETQNDSTTIQIHNPNTGTAARAGLQLTNADASAYVFLTGTGYTGVADWQDSMVLQMDSGIDGGLVLYSADKIRIQNSAGTDVLTVIGSEVGIGTSGPGAKLHVSGTDGIIVPIGTTGERVATQGMVRYNTTTSKFEGYTGAAWVNFH